MTVRLSDVMDQIESQQAADARREAHPAKFYANVTLQIRFPLSATDSMAAGNETRTYLDALETIIESALPIDADIRLIQQSHEGSA